MYSDTSRKFWYREWLAARAYQNKRTARHKRSNLLKSRGAIIIGLLLVSIGSIVLLQDGSVLILTVPAVVGLLRA